jgi:aminopeptidase YwaD
MWATQKDLENVGQTVSLSRSNKEDKKMEAQLQKCNSHIKMLCAEISDRSVGSEGNRAATRYFDLVVSSLGWEIERQEFQAVDWIDGGASLHCGEADFQVFVSPYAPGCKGEAPLIPISSVEELEESAIHGKFVLLHGKIAREQLMPKNFVFFNPEEHQRIISSLEKGAPAAIICATGRNAALTGGVYPFPLIEDGDFEIPSVYMTEEEGSRLLLFAETNPGGIVDLKSISTRLQGNGMNVIARKGDPSGKRLVITAHIDAKKGTPGAIDNASGVVVLLLLADLLKNYAGTLLIEIVALNGEDYYAVPGQMLYLQQNQNRFPEILLNINIDGAGYREGKSAFSFYDLPEEIEISLREVIAHFDGIAVGTPWYQGDHSIFIQNGCPAVAVSSQWFTDNIDSQEITHTPKDNLEIVNCRRLVEIAQALKLFIVQCQTHA